MRICFIAEGSYPYVIGGITSWLNIFIKCFPDYELKTFAIGAKDKDRGKFICRIPDNMTQIEEVFLDTPIKKKVSRFPGRFIRNKKEKQVLMDHFSGKFSDWPAIFEFVDKMKPHKFINFFNSADFYEIVQTIYKENFNNAPYNDFLWTIRTMYIYQFYLLRVDVPEADIYHCVSAGFPGIIASKAVYLNKKPFVLTEHGIYTREREEEIIKSDFIKAYTKELWVQYFRSMSMCAYTFSSKIITQFERNRELEIGFGADKNKTMIIPNGMRVEEINDSQTVRIFGEQVIVGAIARIVPIKDIITMLRSYEKAKMKIPELKLVIVGPTDEDEQYHAYVKDYVIKRNIRDIIFTGKVDYEQYMQSFYSMDMILLTSISEGQPLSLLEAMAYAKPVIATDVGSCSELILGPRDEMGEAGIVAPVMDFNAIARAIIRLAQDSELRKKMGAAGRQRVREFYTIQHMGDAYRKVYEEVVGYL